MPIRTGIAFLGVGVVTGWPPLGSTAGPLSPPLCPFFLFFFPLVALWNKSICFGLALQLLCTVWVGLTPCTHVLTLCSASAEIWEAPTLLAGQGSVFQHLHQHKSRTGGGRSLIWGADSALQPLRISPLGFLLHCAWLGASHVTTPTTTHCWRHSFLLFSLFIFFKKAVR